MKPFWKSRTFWSLALTGTVMALRHCAGREWQGELDTAQTLLMMAGMWFARVGREPLKLRR